MNNAARTIFIVMSSEVSRPGGFAA